MDLEESAALVTGASSGIGAASASALAARGARVALAARRKDVLDELAERIESGGGEALAVPTDITDAEQVEAMVETTRNAFDQIDLLVNSAGVLYTDPVAEADLEEWRQMIEVNLLGAMNATRRVLPNMQARERGHVVFVSSMNARKASPGGSGYCASKFGVNGFAESLRQEVAAEGIRVTVVEPGMAATEMQDEETRAELPMLEPGDLAEAVVYAASQPDSVSVNQLLVRPTAQEF